MFLSSLFLSLFLTLTFLTLSPYVLLNYNYNPRPKLTILKKLMFDFNECLPHKHTRDSLHNATLTYLFNERYPLQQIIVQVHLNGDCMRKTLLFNLSALINAQCSNLPKHNNLWNSRRIIRFRNQQKINSVAIKLLLKRKGICRKGKWALAWNKRI